MSRSTFIEINIEAAEHNLAQVNAYAPTAKIIAMVKANAYGCGVDAIVPSLKNKIFAWGVASIEEALNVRYYDPDGKCILFQGVFSQEELDVAIENDLQCVIHHRHQLSWILSRPLLKSLKVWIKVDTGMHRLGFPPVEVPDLINTLRNCPWIDSPIGLFTHLACADEPERLENQAQLSLFYSLDLPEVPLLKSIANSAAILALPAAHTEIVRPGIMLYGVSPFAGKTGKELGLQPVMRFYAALSAIHNYPENTPIGYSATWKTATKTRIGIVTAGYGDGYPRYIQQASVWINGVYIPIVGRISMDMLTVDLTLCPSAKEGDKVELWGEYVPIEQVAQSANTIGYELLCKVTSRPYKILTKSSCEEKLTLLK